MDCSSIRKDITQEEKTSSLELLEATDAILQIHVIEQISECNAKKRKIQYNEEKNLPG